MLCEIKKGLETCFIKDTYVSKTAS